MKTDKLFYKFFRLCPTAICHLLHIVPACDYTFRTLVLKSERALDGLIEPTEPGHPFFFVEIQGYDDKDIYWRMVEQVTTFFGQNPERRAEPFLAVIIFLDKAYDPGIKTIATVYPPLPWLKHGTLSEFLGAITDGPSPLLVLRPLIASLKEIEAHGADWVQQLRETTNDSIDLVDLMVKFMLQRHKTKSWKEIDKMLRLTPLEETRAWREIRDESIEQGIQQGIEQGIEQGVEQGTNLLRDGVLELLQLRFGALPAKVTQKVYAIHDPDRLKALPKLAATAVSLADFEESLG